MSCISEEQLQSIYDSNDYHMQIESKFDDLTQRMQRIIRAKRSLFIGTPYCSKMKPNKEQTYYLLQRLQNENISLMAELFTRTAI